MADGFDLWGKSSGTDKPYPLICHLLDTAAAAQVITEQVLPPSMVDAVARHMGTSAADWMQAARVLAGWHDIGKASCGFQNADRAACPDWARGYRDAARAGRHDRIGALLVWDRLGEFPVRTRTRAAQIVGGHHGLIPGPRQLKAQHLSALGGAAQVDEAPPSELDSARRWLWETLDAEIGLLPDVSLPTPAAAMALAVVVLADWVASSRDLIREHQSASGNRNFDPEVHFERALSLSAGHLRATGLLAPTRRRRAAPSDLIDEPDPKWTGLQSSIDDSFCPTGPGIAVICAPTGEGKTEAALIAAAKFADASGRHGMFFAMPTVATAEGLHERLEGCIAKLAPADESPTLRRVHSQAILAEDDPHIAVSDDTAATRAAAVWMRGTRKSLLAPFGVGTIDQVLLGALRSKHSPLRILGAATGVLIVDEAHALDPYMRKLLCRTVEWLAALGTPVVILSATLPSKRVRELCMAYQTGCGEHPEVGAELGGYPSWVAWTPADGWSEARSKPRRSWTLRIQVDTAPPHHVTQRITEAALRAAEADGGRCVLVVRSTVAAAQETYRAIRQAAPHMVSGEEVELIHSRMPRAERDRRSRTALRRLGPSVGERPRRLVLVATQVVEQSFDVDFDALITDPAPLAALVQRSGRVRRHRPPSDGEHVSTTVIWAAHDGDEPNYWSPIYPRAELMGAYACITSAGTQTRRVIRVPDDVPGLVERADVEAGEQFQFADDDADDAAEATLAQLVRIDAEKSLASNWSIPPPRADAPLYELTGNLDTDETDPGTRHQAQSVSVLPCVRSTDGWTLVDGTAVDTNPERRPSVAAIRKVFEASIPVSYPNPGWSGELPVLSGAWDRTPAAQGRILDVTAGRCSIGNWELQVDPEAGLVITKEAA